MKSRFILCTLLAGLVVILLSGCSTYTHTVSASNGLSTANKLAFGTLKLEGTINAVTASQAKDLLTLWQGYQSLSNDDTASQLELDALVNQIESNMTSEQIQAIQAMGLTGQSVSESLSTLVGNVTSDTAVSTPNTPSVSLSSSTGGPNGMMPGGSPPSGGDGMGDILGSAAGGTTTQSTPAATQSTVGSAEAQVNPVLLQAVIQLLATRSQSAG
jgi:hypothetical protein